MQIITHLNGFKQLSESAKVASCLHPFPTILLEQTKTLEGGRKYLRFTDDIDLITGSTEKLTYYRTSRMTFGVEISIGTSKSTEEIYAA